MAGPTSLSLRTTGYSQKLAENTAIAANRVVATLAITDRDGGNNLVTLEGADAHLFTLVLGSNGQYSLALQAGTTLDFESNPVLNVTVRARDPAAPANGGVTSSLAIQVTNVNEAPVITSNGGGSAALVQAVSGQKLVTQVHAVDPEGTAVRYSIQGGADASLFAINATTGDLSFKQLPVAGGPTTFQVNVVATEAGSLLKSALTDTQALTIQLNQAPTLTTPVGNVGGDSFTYGVTDADGNPLRATFNGATLATTVQNNGALTTQTVTAAATAAVGTYEVTDGAASVAVVNLGLGTNAADGLAATSPEATLLYGFAGNDTLTGQAGNDTLVGGLGVDAMNGGAGNDLFVYAAAADSNGANTDVVTGVDFGGADVASSADQFRFGNQVVTAVKNIDVTGAAFANLGTLLNASTLGAGEAVFVHVLNGAAQGRDFLFVDGNGQAGFQAATDYAIELVGVVNRAGLDVSDLNA